ncbi:MAG: hypothetical protein KF789_13150 [Bdellovibrionaceae bacterium]|nr:hypothetical protein [Pseudobdellovibrionaceae bacterium]
MKNQNENQQAEVKQAQGFITNPQVYISAETGVLTHRIGNDFKIDMPINLYKSILGLPFEKKDPVESISEKTQRRIVYGLVARPSIYLSKDKKYLIHRVLDTRISKHVNYYKRIFQNAATSVSGEAFSA